jgi:uncharacterized protein (DUF2236 family)
MASMRPGLFAEDTVIRRVNRENVLPLFGGVRALLMQIAHPKVAAGVDEHSDFRRHPIRRLRRTLLMTMAIVFGDRETAMTAARTVNQVHTRVRGDGYHALDPDLLLWVHATLVDTALVTYETFVQRLTPREREDFYQEMKLLGEVLGVPRDHFPAHFPDFEAYMESMIAGPVKVDSRSLELAREIRRPRLRFLPGAAMVPFDVITAGLLHPTLREQLRLPWGRGQQRAFRIALKALPRIVALTPTVLRVWPLPGHNVTLNVATS